MRNKVQIENLPKGAVVVAIPGGLLMISDTVAVKLVEASVIYLCDDCPFYHLMPMAREALLSFTIALDLREDTDEEFIVDPDMAEKIMSAGKGRME